MVPELEITPTRNFHHLRDTTKIHENGTVDFDADGDFESLTDGETETVSVDYTIGQLSTGNLIVNGDFEDHGALTRFGAVVDGEQDRWDTFESIEGWSTPVRVLEIQDGTHGGTPNNPDGNSVLELDSHDSDDTNASVAQTVNVEHAGSYTLNFDYSPRQNGSEVGATSEMSVWVNGVRIATLSSEMLGYQAQSFTFDLDAGVNEIGFSGGGTDDTFGALIDNVSLVGTYDVGATVDIKVQGVNDLADEDECVEVSEDAGLTVLTNALDNAVDPEAGDPFIFAVVDGGVVSETSVGQPIEGSNGGLFTIEADGTTSFDPNGEFEFLGNGESTTTEVIYCVTDADGAVVESFYKVVVQGVNDLADDGEAVTVGEDAGLVVLPNVLDNTVDPEAGDPTVVNVGAPSNGGVFSIGPNGEATFDTNGDFEDLAIGETATTTVEYTVEDAAGDQVTSTVTITVEGVNDLADEGEAVTVGEDSGLTTLPNVLDNTDDPEAGDPTVVNVGAPSNGGVFVINPDGTATFDTNGDFEDLAIGETATTTVEYTVEDAAGDQVTSTVTITVEGVNDLADEGESLTVTEDAGLVALPNVLDNTTDPEAGDPTVVDVGAPTNGGVFTINPDGTATFDTNGEFEDLASGESTTTSVTYTVEDAAGDQVTSTVEIIVKGFNDLADDDETATVGEDAGLVALDNVLDNTTDPEAGDPVVVNVGTASNGGVFSIAPDGTATFDTNGDFEDLGAGETATTSVTYTVEDAAGDQVSSTVTVTVLGAEEPFGSIAGRSFCDADGNAVDSTGDTAIVQQTVVLLNPDGTAVLDTFGDPILAFTEVDGTYIFDPIPVGDYRVGFEILGNKDFVAQGEDLDNDGR